MTAPRAVFAVGSGKGLLLRYGKFLVACALPCKIFDVLAADQGLAHISFSRSAAFSRRFDEPAANLLELLEGADFFAVTYLVLAACYPQMARLDDAGEIVSRLRAITP
jgi:hypothetical protein